MGNSASSQEKLTGRANEEMLESRRLMTSDSFFIQLLIWARCVLVFSVGFMSACFPFTSVLVISIKAKTTHTVLGRRLEGRDIITIVAHSQGLRAAKRGLCVSLHLRQALHRL